MNKPGAITRPEGESMFEFLEDIGNYDERVVSNNEYVWGEIDTCRVSDGRRPYETAVKHEDYGARWIIVEAYDDVEEARLGHERWVRTMTKAPSEELVDCLNSGVAQVFDALGGVQRFPRKANGLSTGEVS